MQAMTSNPICPDNPDHGEMEIEPWYLEYSEEKQVIGGYGYWCQVKGCDGYGGTIEKHKTDEVKGKYHAKANSRTDDQERESEPKHRAGKKTERQLTYLHDME